MKVFWKIRVCSGGIPGSLFRACVDRRDLAISVLFWDDVGTGIEPRKSRILQFLYVSSTHYLWSSGTLSSCTSNAHGVLSVFREFRGQKRTRLVFLNELQPFLRKDSIHLPASTCKSVLKLINTMCNFSFDFYFEIMLVDRILIGLIPALTSQI
jgi:hypothetical protein